ncbi:MAG: hypothetical protein ABW185_00570 [Sedimenticola sp.]
MPPKRPAQRTSARGKPAPKRRRTTPDDPDPQQTQTADVVSAVINELQKRGVIPAASSGTVDESENLAQDGTLVDNQPDNTSSGDQVRQLLDMESDTTLQTAGSTPHRDESTGAGIHITNVPPPATMATYNLSLGALLSDKVKQSIWNNEFVEFSSLLPSAKQDNTIQVNLAGTSISVLPSVKEAKTLAIGQWVTAFHIYMDIYVQKHRNEVPGLLVYCELVRDLDRAYGVAAFNYYDRTFRAHRQTQNLPWAAMHSELWIKATTLALAVPSTRTQSLPQTKLPNPCHKFNKGSCQFPNCRFSHTCSFCGKRHARANCFALQNQRKPSGAKSTATGVAAATPHVPSGSGQSQSITPIGSNAPNKSFRALADPNKK